MLIYVPVRPLLVQDPVSAATAPDRLPPLQTHEAVAVATGVLHGARGVGGVGLRGCVLGWGLVGGHF